MHQHISSRAGIMVLLVALMAAAFPTPAYAIISVLNVSPNSVVNNAASTITITGTDFLDGAQVDVGGTLVATTWVDAATLTAVIPAGFTSGTYTVKVTNPDTTTSSLNSGLTVTEPSASFIRPQIAVKTYSTNPADVRYGQDFRLIVKLRNEGQASAFNVQASFTSSDFLPLKTGGVVIVGDLIANNSIDVEQVMTAATYVYGIVSVDMNLAYSDVNGATYTEKFTLNIRVTGGSYVNVATSTPTGVKNSQLVITSYAASIDPLQPGEQFSLTMTVQNTGNVGAQRVTMIVGGGSSSGSIQLSRQGPSTTS